MDRKTQWISFGGGLLVFVLGVKRLFQSGDWALMIIGMCILGFSISGMIKAKQKKP